MEPEIKPEEKPEVPPTPEVKPEVKPEIPPTPEVKPEPAGKKRIEVDEEEFEGMKTRLTEMETRSRKKAPEPETKPPAKARAIDRLHGSIFGRK